MWIHPIIEERQRKGHFHPLFAEVQRDEKKFFNFTRMSRSTFYELLAVCGEKLAKKDTPMRNAITSEEKLVITIRYLATGCSLAELHYNFRIGRSTASNIIQEVCEAIWIELADKVIPQCSTEKWIEIAKVFQTCAQFLNCIGAIDGNIFGLSSHSIVGLCTTYNYKQYYSTYCLRCAMPIIASLGDKTFPLSENLLRPFGGKQLTPLKETFNARLTRARRYIECCFGILANKWRIFHRPIDATVVKAACALHNFIRTRDGTRSNDEKLDENINLEGLAPDTTHRGNPLALSARDKYAQYFVKQKTV
ncbi:unnamed protein product [Acanthoscelides obtectus]|uniref:DDE Tnp4 domain-containing protein n=1 Tax=Acanthoscelides obtectus TaxID=200917 RepID=A0A9P0LH99_ACAOB|nr:unnamed protein product [Acanthoscelides obtectus]CAK1623184.1 hypothetical protein AOBTE_LOCUS1867 [Acanthoscelides obtectus]